MKAIKSSTTTTETSIKLMSIWLLSVSNTFVMYDTMIRPRNIHTILLFLEIGRFGEVSMASSENMPCSFSTFLICLRVSKSSSSFSGPPYVSSASYNGDLSLLSLMFEFAPLTRSCLITLKFPFLMALCRGVYPHISCESRFIFSCAIR